MPPKLKSPGEPVHAPKARGAAAIIVGVLAAAAVLIAFSLGSGTESAEDALSSAPPHAAPLPVPPGSRELLDGLGVGDSLGSWNVHVLRIIDRQLGIDLLQGEKVLTIWIAKKGSRPALPPRETERYAIYYGYPVESQAQAARDIDTILADIEQRIRRTEQTVPVPAGL